MDYVIPIVGFLLIAAAVCGVAIAAHRFERKQRLAGKWDAHGPIHPSEPPANWDIRPALGVRPPTIESDDEDELDSDDEPPHLHR